MNKKMIGRKLIRLSQLKEKMAIEKLEEIDWVTFGVILKKITPQSSNSVSYFINQLFHHRLTVETHVLDLLPRAHQCFILQSLLVSSQIATPSPGWYQRGRSVRKALLKEGLIRQVSYAFYCPHHSYSFYLLFGDACGCPTALNNPPCGRGARPQRPFEEPYQM